MAPEPGQAALRKAIRDALTERNMTQRELGAEVGHLEDGPAIPQQSVAEWLAGRVTLTPARIFTIERALRMKPGALSRLEGYMPVGQVPVMTPEEAIDADPDISPTFARLLVGTVQQARQETRAARQAKRARR
jgi:transcriptional regulator with XRE-family HTH domain